MHRLKHIICLLIPALLLLGACDGGQEKERSVSFFAMDTYMSLRLYGGSEELPESLKEEVLALEALLSVTKPDSEIARLNRGEAVALSPDTRQILEQALSLGRESGGVLDISIYPLLRAWGFTTGQYRVPSPEEIQKLLQSVDYRKIDLSGNALQLETGMALDLGSVAKGYAADRLTERIRQAGVSSALLDLGGNIQAIGEKPDGSPWQIGIRNPDGEGYVGKVSVRDKALVTSGNYERHFTGEDGRDYGHILDPLSGCPVDNELLSVTVVGHEGWRCDGLSTALFVMGPERALAHWRQARDYDMILVTKDGWVYITEGLKDCFSLSQTDLYRLEVWSLD